MEKSVLTTGIKGNRELVVTKELTAQAMGSGELPVFATPEVIALAEETAWRSVAAYLEPGQGTVGTMLQVEHISATPVGMKVRCETELIEIDRRKLTFSVEVFDEAGVVAKGTHCRFIVENEKLKGPTAALSWRTRSFLRGQRRKRKTQALKEIHECCLNCFSHL